MEIETIKKIIKSTTADHIEKEKEVKVAERYYENDNDILMDENPSNEKADSSDHPLRNADNRISHPWHQLLVDQKAAYTMTIPPTFDVGDEELNDKIVTLLGDHYPKVAKDLAVNAANAGEAWLHVWKDEGHQNFFRYAIVESAQIIAIYSKKLGEKLKGILRTYEDTDEKGEAIYVYEFWNDETCHAYYREATKNMDDIAKYSNYSLIDVSTGDEVSKTNVFEHGWGKIPFICFRNNPLKQSDLKKYKKQIDVYDKIYSGFVNDLDDIQEIIFVLTNYGGEDKQEFLDDLNRYKMVKLDADSDEKSGIDTLAIEIPIEARKEMLDITRESIFTHGQGVDPQRSIGQNNSGAALKHMYSLLELKSSMLETEFKLGFAELVRFILIYLGADPDKAIEQTWERTAIDNDLEKADIISRLANHTSEENIAKSNPLVEDASQELEYQRGEYEREARAEDDYRDKDAEKKIRERVGDSDD